MVEIKDSVLYRRTITKCLLFILTVLVGYFGVAYCYLISEYPTSTLKIKQNLNSAGITIRYTVEEGKNSGHSEMGLVEYLSKKNSEKLDYYLYHIIRAELAILLVSLLIAAGLMLLDPKLKNKSGT